jgi:hypothetical protein
MAQRASLVAWTLTARALALRSIALLWCNYGAIDGSRRKILPIIEICTCKVLANE